MEEANGRPCASWLQHVDQHLKEIGMGQASAWGMARRRPLEYRWKVDAARAALAHAPIPDLRMMEHQALTQDDGA